MSFTDSLKSLTTDDFITFSCRFFNMCDTRMTRYGESSTKPYRFGGALSYGWDWPTFGVYFPMMRARWSAICAEAKRRGIEKIKR